MLYWVALFVLVGLGAAWFVAGQRRKRRHQDHLARRAERQRRRIIEWSVLEWLYGRRAHLRITHRRGAEPAGNGAAGED